MPPTIEFEFGDIVLVPFPFTDQRSSKRRPAAVVSTSRYNQGSPGVILMAVTSQPGTGGLGAPISGWQEAGLVAPSTLKPVIATVERTLVIRKLGRLPEADRTSLSGLLSNILGSS
ncbi:MAG: type II toxin-antitoxin system PemK/MazF family toxin [Candidatus Coatesbacteria bacterium]